MASTVTIGAAGGNAVCPKPDSWDELEALLRAAERGRQTAPADLLTWLNQHEEAVSELASNLEDFAATVSDATSDYAALAWGCRQVSNGLPPDTAVLALTQRWSEVLMQLDGFYEKVDVDIRMRTGLESPKIAESRKRAARRLRRTMQYQNDLKRLR